MKPFLLLWKKGVNYLLKRVFDVLKQRVIATVDPLFFSEKYIVKNNDFPKVTQNIFSDSNLKYEKDQKEFFSLYFSMIKEHRFDLLGSGWLKNSCQSKSPGLRGYLYSSKKNIPFRKKMHRKINKKINEIIRKISPDYIPIDWHRDMKSGYRWDKNIWYRNIDYAHRIGVDIKFPWELSRMNHMSRLAFYSQMRSDKREDSFREFMCQFLDFYASNPIGYGVNWRSNMDVSIRGANLLIARDLFGDIKVRGVNRKWFEHLFSKSIYEHGRFVYDNLEYSPYINSNHYIAELCGLIIIAIYIEKNSETSQWLDHCLIELKKELERQFFEDGSSIENSIYYHSFVLDMIVFTLGICKKSGILIDDFDMNRIRKAIGFMKNVRINGKKIPVMGDCDSGVFIKTDIHGDIINKDDALKKYKGLYENKVFWKDQNITVWLDEDMLFYEYPFEQEFSIKGQILGHLYSKQNICPRVNTSYSKNIFKPKVNEVVKEFVISKEGVNKGDFSEKGIRSVISVYEDGKWAVISNNTIKCVISLGAGSVKDWISGHCHNDALSFVLEIQGEVIVNDPGCDLYTPFFDKRYIQRSTFVHNTAFFEKIEQNIILKEKRGLFYTGKASDTDFFVEGDKLFIRLSFDGKDESIIRTFIPGDSCLKIIDSSEKEFKQNIYDGKGTAGYGKMFR